MRFVAALAVLTACNTYAHRSTLNAPGNIELAVPVPRENGDPTRFEPATEPGAQTIAIIAAPYIAGGVGRYEAGRDGTGEVGLEFRVEHTKSAGQGLMTAENWGATLGFAFAQFGDGARTVAPGAFSVELNYRFLAKVWPIDVGLGPAFYVDDTSIGGQLSVRVAIALLRARYVANTGAEFLLGVEVPIPLFFSWSR